MQLKEIVACKVELAIIKLKILRVAVGVGEHV